MPHAEPSDSHHEDREAQEEADILRRVFEDPDFQERFAQASDPGEKAEGAIDYADIDDDDLAEDEDEARAPVSFDQSQGSGAGTATHDLPELEGNLSTQLEEGLGADTLDDLFGDAPSSPTDGVRKQTGKSGAMSYDFEGDEIFGEPIGPIQDGSSPSFPTIQDNLLSSRTQAVADLFTQEEPLSEEFLQQQRLFERSRAAFGYTEVPPPPPENEEEALASMWPMFEKESVPKFMELMPPKKARYVGKAPIKPPKPVQPTKVNLDIEADQEKAFKLSAGLHTRNFDAQKDFGLVAVSPEPGLLKSDDDEEDESDYENNPVGGKTWQDLQVICADWEINSPPPELVDTSPLQLGSDDLFGRPGADDSEPHTVKRRKLNDFGSDIQNILNAPRFSCPSFDNYEKLATKAAKRPILDLNDPYLLLVEQPERAVKKQKTTLALQDGRAVSTKDALRRYNISNDDASEKLKQNHQNKVRSTLGNLTITHSMPALRLQFPYYKTKLNKWEARSFHRPVASFHKETITFSVPKHVKKKHLKGKDTQAIFSQTSDLSFADNSSVLLLEYSEEYPTMLQNFGMGSRLVNYYRKKHPDDPERPKSEIGETSLLLPNDTSPLTQFGEIKSGEMTPTIFNSMFKAPVFEHQPKATDFLVIRSSTGVGGPKWYLRNIEHLRVVGQQFPSVEVPPPGGRKVTTASKNRLRMICYRLMKRKPPKHRIAVQDVTPHIAESSDMQNRQKMKDFLKFDKENKEWVMPTGQTLPDDDAIRALISPEDVCLLDSMQVGEQHLADEGFGNEFLEQQNEDDEVKEGQSIEQQLAPWQTTKNFLNAAANKAMLQVHGEGDPTGRGEAFSFLKVSMKGGFRALGESVEDRLDAKKLKEYGGHNYNVQKQAEQYRDTIQHVWDAQKLSLSTAIEHSDPEPDPDDISEPSRRSTSRTDFASSGLFKRRDDETVSHMSRFSTDSQSGRVLKIYRKVRDPAGQIKDDVQIVEDPRVWKKYVALKNKSKLDSIDIRDIRPGDDPALARAKLEKELGRLERNRDRRFAREKQKAGVKDESPSSPNSPAPGAAGGGGGGRGGPGTQRKCANCGQVGHIKTNKKLCPMLNGTIKPEESGFGESGFSSSAPPVS